MLPRSYRLRDRDIIKKVFAGRRENSSLFDVWIKNVSPPPQLLVVVGSKVSKKAHERNKIRRQVHEAFREIIPNVPKSAKVVVVVKKSVLRADYNELKNLVSDLVLKNSAHGS